MNATCRKLDSGGRPARIMAILIYRLISVGEPVNHCCVCTYGSGVGLVTFAGGVMGAHRCTATRSQPMGPGRASTLN